ncbi:MAG: hypothetical protein IPK91_03855 [Saprospiraceae bacterium]|nr:hypothetical protein [Saprospiraceae bacterium]MBK8296411.1 hypothetical protein [Saprospiraceae bacterium]
MVIITLAKKNGMTIKRQKLIETFQVLPDDISLDEILDHIMLMDKIEEGLR